MSVQQDVEKLKAQTPTDLDNDAKTKYQVFLILPFLPTCQKTAHYETFFITILPF